MIDNKVEEIKKHFESIMEILNIPKDADTENSPLRIAKMYCLELFKNRNNYNIDDLNSTMKLFPCEGYSVPVTVKDIPFYSICTHHFMPFSGFVSVTYIPNGQIIGLSKIPRVVEYFSKMPQLQERFTTNIGEYLVNIIKPKYLKVEVYDTNHTCVSARGIEKDCSTNTVYEYKVES